MKTKITLFLMLITNLFFAQNNRFVENELIVKLTQNEYERAEIDMQQKRFGIQSLDDLNTHMQVVGVSQIGQHKFTRTFLLKFHQSVAVETLAETYKNLGIFEYTTPNYFGTAGGSESEIIPNDPRFVAKQWSLYNTGVQTNIGPAVTEDADVDMELAWDIETGDPDMIIAVVDGGARMTHPDFASRIWTNPAETANGIDDDGNGLIDDLTGWDFFFDDNDTTDERGHGMNVCSIIGAIANNNNLYVGANWNSKIMVLKAIDFDLNATYASVANSVYYAVDHGAKIINYSIGFSPASPLLEDWVIYANNQNVLISACMMNFNNDITYYPAGYSLTYPNIIACGSTSANDYRTVPFDWSTTSGSNYGTHINVTAPGSYIYNLAYNNDLAGGVYWSGTSMATPLVASIASLVWAQAPDLTPLQVRTIIENTAQDQVGNPTEDTPGFDHYMGHGRANAFAAVQAAQALATQQFGQANAQELQMLNPSRNNTLQIISKGIHTGNYALIVNSLDGKLLQNSVVNIKAGHNEIEFIHPVGSYIVTLKGESYSKIFKVLQQ